MYLLLFNFFPISLYYQTGFSNNALCNIALLQDMVFGNNINPYKFCAFVYYILQLSLDLLKSHELIYDYL